MIELDWYLTFILNDATQGSKRNRDQYLKWIRARDLELAADNFEAVFHSSKTNIPPWMFDLHGSSGQERFAIFLMQKLSRFGWFWGICSQSEYKKFLDTAGTRTGLLHRGWFSQLTKCPNHFEPYVVCDWSKKYRRF